MEHQDQKSVLGGGSQTLKAVDVLRLRHGVSERSQDVVAVEVPVALEYNGISHAVMLASPGDLEDFALGFSLSEGIIAHASEMYECEAEITPEGWHVRIRIAAERFAGLKERRRSLAGRTGCGLCGTESLSQVTRCVAPVTHRHRFDGMHLLGGMSAMQTLQLMQQQSGATHAAGWMNAMGGIDFVREDVGRHNALDKLIGAMAVAGKDFTTGALLITSRASYEMVQKAAVMNVGLIAAISAPTSFAVQLAESTGVTLAGFMRDQSYVVYACPERLNNI
ncbi:MAG: formate dehydrogenase associated protein [Pseudomonadota bacterium]|jgi:FdhD protein|nr:formate dehydrogenase accessory sulfurtransferase FdhD [Oxalobacteraceae bacterium]